LIAKRVRRVKGGSHFGRLARYVVDALGGADPASWQRTADYILDTAEGGAKVGGVRISNCISEDPAAATLEILARQARNTRARGDKTYHLVISFPPGERPALERLHYIEDELCKAIGLAEHQRISAVHTDTEHLHVHVAISKVHPETLHCIEPYFDKRKLMEACARLEIELGLTRTHHGEGLEVEREGWRIAPRLRGGAEGMEAHAGRQSLIAWVRERCGERLKKAGSWAELHAALAEHGLTVRQRGAGMVFATAAGQFIKASDVDATLSLPQCVKRWGAFQPSAAPQPEAQTRYEGEPKQEPRSARPLWDEYQGVREKALVARQEARARLRNAHEKYAQKLSEWYQAERQRIKTQTHLTRAQRRAAYQSLAQRRRVDFQARRELEAQQRRELSVSHPLPTWQGFLERKGLAGDSEALGLLRQRARSRARGRADEVRGERARAGTSGLKPSGMRKSGDLLYELSDGGLVIASGDAIRVERRSESAMSLALELASDQFKGQRLDVDGSEAFRAGLARAAGEHAFGVRFASAAMEAVREASAADGPAAGADAYIRARNELRASRPNAGIAYHRRWNTMDAGEARYEGRRRFADGSEAVLLRRGEDMLVLDVSGAQAAKASAWAIGQTINIDTQGRILSGARRRGR
jgi:hypothetical protein